MRTIQISMAIMGMFLFFVAMARADQSADDRILDNLDSNDNAQSQVVLDQKPEVYKAIEPDSDAITGPLKAE